MRQEMFCYCRKRETYEFISVCESVNFRCCKCEYLNKGGESSE